MIDECDGCVKEYFADKWVDFINWYMENHPEFCKEFKKFEDMKKGDEMKEGIEVASSKEIKIKKGSVITLKDDRNRTEIRLGRIIYIGTNNFFETNLGYQIVISEE